VKDTAVIDLEVVLVYVSLVENFFHASMMRGVLTRVKTRGMMRGMHIVQVDQERAERFLGASEAAGILGLDKYNPPIKIWRRHRGLDVDDRVPDHVSEAAEWGHLHEPIVRGKYALMTRSVVEVPTRSTVKDDWLRCTPDGLVFGYGRSRDPGVHSDDDMQGDAGDREGLVQCKTADAYLEHEWADGPPPKYEVQVRVEMAVMGLPWCDVICLIGGNRISGPHRIMRDEIIEARILRDLKAFWALVQSGTEPTVDHTDQWRLHVSEKMRTTKLVIKSDGDIGQILEDLRAARIAREASKARVERLTTDLLLRMSAAGAQAIEDDTYGRFSAFRAGAGMDWKGYAEHLERELGWKPGDNADGRADFKRPSTKWTIRVPKGFTAGDDE
jgi:predicted phage-related endonuclease